MTEAAYVELPVLVWLCGEPKPGAPPGGLGWTFRDEAAMAAFDEEAPVLQTDQNHHRNLLPLFVLAVVILLVFAWTYIRY
jgi:hypothetical protein